MMKGKKKRRSDIAVAASVWLAALGSSAALTYDLNRPLHSGRDVAEVVSSSRSVLTKPVAEPGVLIMPTITIVGQIRLPSAPGAARGED